MANKGLVFFGSVTTLKKHLSLSVAALFMVVGTAACGGEARSGDAARASFAGSLFGVRERTAGLELIQLIPPFPEGELVPTGSNTFEQSFRIEGKVVNLTKRSMDDVEVRVTWLAPNGRHIGSGRAYVVFWPDGYKSLEPTSTTCPHCYAAFQFDQKVEFTRDEWSSTAGELVRASKVKLEFEADGKEVTFRASEREAERIAESDMIVMPDERTIRETINEAHELMNAQRWADGFKSYDGIVTAVEPFKSDLRSVYGEALCGRAAAHAMLNRPSQAAEDYALAFASANIQAGMASSYGQKDVEAAYDAGWEIYASRRKASRD